MSKNILLSTKEKLENVFSESINVLIADKPDWLILKTKTDNKTFGCIRFNKNSFMTLYIDTKPTVKLATLKEAKGFEHIGITSRQTGNFIQNKFNIPSETDMKLVVIILKLVIENRYIKTGEKIRS